MNLILAPIHSKVRARPFAARSTRKRWDCKNTRSQFCFSWPHLDLDTFTKLRFTTKKTTVITKSKLPTDGSDIVLYFFPLSRLARAPGKKIHGTQNSAWPHNRFQVPWVLRERETGRFCGANFVRESKRRVRALETSSFRLRRNGNAYRDGTLSSSDDKTRDKIRKYTHYLSSTV